MAKKKQLDGSYALMSRVLDDDKLMGYTLEDKKAPKSKKVKKKT